jgi:peptide/nickel transport system substrate-binding protein
VNTANISGYPADNDPIYKNSTYADNFTTILMYQGTLKPAN